MILVVQGGAKSEYRKGPVQSIEITALPIRHHFGVSPEFPLAWMHHNSSTHHVQIDVGETTEKMVIGFHCGCMIAVFPECAFAFLSLIELLSSSTGNQLHRSRYYFASPAIENKQMNVVGCGDVVQHAQSIAPSRFKKPSHPRPAIFGEFEEELLLMASVSYMPGVSCQEMSSGSGHLILSCVQDEVNIK